MQILELFQRIAPLAGLGIFEQNFITGSIYCNPVMRQIFEVGETFFPSLEESIGYYQHPERMRALLDNAIRTGLPEAGQLELVTANRNRKWVKVRLQADYEQEKCIGIYGTLEDVTENIRLLNLLEEREKRFSNAFDFAPIGMALVSLTGSWIKINASLTRLLGYGESEFLRHTFQDYTHPEDLDTDLGNLNELLDGKTESYSMEKRYFHKDGRVIWTQLNVSLVRDEHDKPLYFISQIKDISERKRYAETIRAQNSRLLNFTHIVSHNLRSHAGNIQMLSDMIISEGDRGEQMSLIRMLHANAGNLIETLDNLNEVIKIQDNAQAEKTPVHLGEVTQRVFEILSAAVLQSHADIVVNNPDDIWLNIVPAYIESIFINLITNAIKYRNPDRALKITVDMERRGTVTSIRIADNGLGMDLDLHGHKLFGMYKTFHRHPDARGMGLFLVKNQVEAMGGRIWADSQPGAGMTFTIEFECLLPTGG